MQGNWSMMLLITVIAVDDSFTKAFISLALPMALQLDVRLARSVSAVY